MQIPGAQGAPGICVSSASPAVRTFVAGPETDANGRASTQTVRDRFKSDSIEAMDMAPRDVDQFLGQKVAGYAKIVTDLGLPQE